MNAATVVDDGRAVVTAEARNAVEAAIENLRNDWDVSGRDLEGGTGWNGVVEEGTYVVGWSDLRESIALSVGVELPERYVGGEYATDDEVHTDDGDDEDDDGRSDAPP